MAVLKVVEILASSDQSWEAAALNALNKASESLKNVKSCYIQEQSMALKADGKPEYRVNTKITFEVQ